MFKFHELITKEEQAIMRGIANGMKFDKKGINKQLIEARRLNK